MRQQILESPAEEKGRNNKAGRGRKRERMNKKKREGERKAREREPCRSCWRQRFTHIQKGREQKGSCVQNSSILDTLPWQIGAGSVQRPGFQDRRPLAGFRYSVLARRKEETKTLERREKKFVAGRCPVWILATPGPCVGSAAGSIQSPKSPNQRPDDSSWE